MAPPPTEHRTASRGRELQVLATMLAVILWGVFLFDVSSGTERGRLSGLPIGTDFVYFYTMAHVGLSGHYDALASDAAFANEQLRVVPTADTLYPPVYPPQLAVLLSPLARLSYRTAYVTWISVTLTLYGLMVWRLVAASDELRRWPAQTAAVAAANPALWFTALHGQMSVLALVALTLTWAALRRGYSFATGAALGLLAFKPSLFVPTVAILVLARQWRILAGAALGMCSLWLAFFPRVGIAESRQYLIYTIGVLGNPDAVASNLPLMHSVRTFWAGLLPPAVATVAYAGSAALVVAWTGRLWRAAEDPTVRTGALAIGVVLASPHLFAYDLLILVPALAAAAHVAAVRGVAGLQVATMAVFTAPLWGIPLALLGFQASTIAVAAWLERFGGVTGSQTRRPHT
jgi:hypothetical protein